MAHLVARLAACHRRAASGRRQTRKPTDRRQATAHRGDWRHNRHRTRVSASHWQDASGAPAQEPPRRNDAQYVCDPKYVDSLALRHWNSDGAPGPNTYYYCRRGANYTATAAVSNTEAVVERFACTPYGERNRGGQDEHGNLCPNIPTPQPAQEATIVLKSATYTLASLAILLAAHGKEVPSVRSDAERELEESMLQTDWDAVARALEFGGIPLGRSRREQAIKYCTAHEIKLDRNQILNCVFDTMQKAEAHGYGACSPDAISDLVNIADNKAFSAESRAFALRILALNLDCSKEGKSLEELLWTRFEDRWDPDGKKAFLSSLAVASWIDNDDRINRFKDLFRTLDVADDNRLQMIGAVAIAVGDSRCSVYDGLELYAIFLRSDELKKEHRKAIADMIEGWVTISRNVHELNKYREESGETPETN